MEAAQLIAGLHAPGVACGEPVPALQFATVGFISTVHVRGIAHLPANEATAVGEGTQCTGRRRVRARNRE